MNYVHETLFNNHFHETVLRGLMMTVCPYQNLLKTTCVSNDDDDDDDYDGDGNDNGNSDAGDDDGNDDHDDDGDGDNNSNADECG